MKQITEREVCMHLVRRGKMSPTKFLKQYELKNLDKALKDNRTSINLKWCIKELLKILRDEDTNAATKVLIIDKLRDIILLGAVQDEELISQMRTVARENPPHAADLFELKVAKEA